MKSICVFCGSSTGNNEIYSQQAKKLGIAIAKANLELIYGGGKVGLMGIVADEVLRQNGKVTGVIPDFLYKKEVAHEGLSNLIIVESMHERKLKMSTLADSFIAMPGGFGTLEELAEIITWNQLNLVNKPVGILNVGKFYNSLLDYFDTMVEEGFVNVNFRKTIISEGDPAKLINSLNHRKISGNEGNLRKL
ncbi:MAG: TIGR00730 family Rossman fold protein [Candidatus Cyclobacteriaceae bacterium M2_1C_046]